MIAISALGKIRGFMINSVRLEDDRCDPVDSLACAVKLAGELAAARKGRLRGQTARRIFQRRP